RLVEYRIRLFGYVGEHRVRFVGGLLVDAVQGVGDALAFLLGVAADRIEGLGDRAGAAGGGFGGQARDLARPLLGVLARFVQHGRQARPPRLDIVALVVAQADP